MEVSAIPTGFGLAASLAWLSRLQASRAAVPPQATGPVAAGHPQPSTGVASAGSVGKQCPPLQLSHAPATHGVLASRPATTATEAQHTVLVAPSTVSVEPPAPPTATTAAPLVTSPHQRGEPSVQPLIAGTTTVPVAGGAVFQAPAPPAAEASANPSQYASCWTSAASVPLPPQSTRKATTPSPEGCGLRAGSQVPEARLPPVRRVVCHVCAPSSCVLTACVRGQSGVDGHQCPC